MKPFILASSSPRRKELLQQISYSFETVASQVNEQAPDSLPPESLVELLAERKAQEIWRSYPDAVVLGADTVVVYKQRILGKPESKEEASEMLRMLSGKTHSVYTGVALVNKEKKKNFPSKDRRFLL